jgi:hypothetical protein
MEYSSHYETILGDLGRSRARARKPRLEEVPSFKVERFVSAGILREGAVASVRLSGTRVHMAMKAGFLALQADGRPPQLLRLFAYTGGVDGRVRRTLAFCGCGRRASLLVLNRDWFACRHCFGLRYESDYRLPHDQILDRMAKLVAQVGGEGVPAAFPERPRFMKRSHYARLAAEFHELDERWQAAAFEHLFPKRKA